MWNDQDSLHTCRKMSSKNKGGKEERKGSERKREGDRHVKREEEEGGEIKSTKIGEGGKQQQQQNVLAVPESKPQKFPASGNYFRRKLSLSRALMTPWTRRKIRESSDGASWEWLTVG